MPYGCGMATTPVADTAQRILEAPESAAMTRSMLGERKDVDLEKRTVDLSFASPTPVERDFGEEVLICTEEACDLSRLRDGGALLMDHNPRDQVGVVEKVYFGGGKVRAVVRFSKAARAQEIFQDVVDGIRSLVSVGYQIRDVELANRGGNMGDRVNVTRWQPYEVSIVSIPADPNVGKGRNRSQTTQKQMSTESTAPATAPAPVTAQVRSEPAPASNRISEIIAIGTNFKVPQERINKALAENEPLDSFRTFVMETHMRATPVTVPPTIGMSKAEKRRYSMVRAINRLSSNQPLDGLEREASDECAKKFRREAPAAGFIMPHDVQEYSDREMIAAMLRVSPSLGMSRYGQNLSRALTAGNFSGAGALIAEDFLGGSFIELLRNRTLLTQLGVGTMSGLVGNVVIPRQSAAATAYWLAEGEAVTATQQQFAQVGGVPKRLSAQTAYNKQLLAQSTLDAEALVRDDHIRIIAIAKDLAGIAGTGGAQPRGILNGPTTDPTGGGNNISTVTFGGAATRANLLTFMSSIQTANADIGTMQWLVNPNTRAKWQSIPQVPNYPVYLTSDEGQTIGYPTPFTNQIGTTGSFANRALFGAWGQAMFLDWAGYDVVVDPYTRAANNEIVCTVNLFTDFVVRHWPAFCVSTDTAAA